MPRRILPLSVIIVLLLVSLIFSSQSAFATTPTPSATPSCQNAIYTVFGRVYDATNPNQGITNASVHAYTSVAGSPNTTTGPDGSYSLVIDNPYHGCHVLGLVVHATGYQSVSQEIYWQDLMAQPERNFGLQPSGNLSTPTRTSTTRPTATRTRTVHLPPPTRTRTPTPGVVLTATRTPTAPTPITATPTAATSTCSPVVLITAPFVKDGSGILCWQVNNISSHINSFGLNKLTVNGVDFTNMWVPVQNLPPKINGYWYIFYNSSNPWGHFEAK